MSEKDTSIIEIEIPLTDIDADFNWNARSSGFMMLKDEEGSEGKTSTPDQRDTGNTGFLGLVASIRTTGQHTAVDVRKHPKGGHKKPYSLITGFQRYEALRRLGATTPPVPVPGLKPGHIRVIVRDVDETAARIMNVQENTARKNLSGPDICFSVSELKKVIPADKYSDATVAEMLQLSRPYVQQMRTIAEKVDRKVVEAWRSAPVQLTKNQMLGLADTDKDKQASAYEALLANPKEKAKPGPKAQSDMQEATCTAAHKKGMMLGKLVKMGCLDPVDPDWSQEALEVLGVKFADKVGPKQLEEACNNAQAGFEAGQTEDEEKAGEEKKKSDA